MFYVVTVTYELLVFRWDRETYTDRSIEDLKERYYGVTNTLSKVI